MLRFGPAVLIILLSISLFFPFYSAPSHQSVHTDIQIFDENEKIECGLDVLDMDVFIGIDDEGNSENDRYLYLDDGKSVVIYDEGMDILISTPEGEVNVSIQFVNPNEVRSRGVPIDNHQVNLINGDRVKNIRTSLYDTILYEDIWDGIDLRLYLDSGYLRYDLIVHRYGDPLDIRFKVVNHKGIHEQGPDLRIDTQVGPIVNTGLRTYYQDMPDEVIPSGFRVIDEDTFGFELEDYDRSMSIVIDPIIESMLIGGEGDHSFGRSVATDASGNTYLAGVTSSSHFRTFSALDSSYNGGESDIVVFKVAPHRSTPLFSTYIGGGGEDRVHDIQINSRGQLCIVGDTNSVDFPTTREGTSENMPGKRDVFVSVLSRDGARLEQSILIGGSESDGAAALRLDDADYLYVTGRTLSPDFPTTPGAFDETFNGHEDAFVMKLEPDLSSIVFSTFIGGSSDLGDQGVDIDLDPKGNPVVLGITESPDFPVTEGAFDTQLGDYDMFVAKFKADGSSLVFSTFIGGRHVESAYQIAVDDDGRIYVTGYTTSDDFPTTPDAFDDTLDGEEDAVMVKLRPDGTGLIWSTYIGGSGKENSLAISINSKGEVVLAGTTSSTDFPTTTNAFDRSHNGGHWDIFICLFDPNCTDLMYSSLYGGSGREAPFDILIGSGYNIRLIGGMNSTDFKVERAFTADELDHNYNILYLRIRLGCPSAPRNLVSEVNDGQATLKWDVPLSIGDAEITGYNVYRSYDNDTFSLLKTVDNKTSFNDTDVFDEKIIYYRVGAVNEYGEGPLSESTKVIEDRSTQSISPILIIVVIVIIVVMIASWYLHRSRDDYVP